MTVELSLIITIVSVSFALFSGIMSIRRSNKTEDTANASQITTVIVKLENIGDDVKEIKEKLRRVEEEIRGLDKRVTIVEQSTKSAHHRLDAVIGHVECKED